MPSTTRTFAQQLRTRMSDAEQHLWQQLRAKRFVGYKFRRQVPIGPYIVDFVCFSQRIVVELDGSQHVDSSADLIRTEWLNQQGFRVLRFWNDQVFIEEEGVLMAIWLALTAPPPLPQPLSREGRGE